VSTDQPPPWASWAPPLDPPEAGGLSYDTAQAIAEQWWTADPHEAAALMWEAYAATLPQTPVVASVTTGAQSVAYGAAQPGGAFGLAVARANWHRAQRDTGITAELVAPHPFRHDDGGWFE
jgi:hypothetical protein